MVVSVVRNYASEVVVGCDLRVDQNLLKLLNPLNGAHFGIESALSECRLWDETQRDCSQVFMSEDLFRIH